MTTKTRDAPRVTAVYPSGQTLPANTLRFYVHFSRPMAPRHAAERVKLRDASGAADDAAFMTFKQELWNEDRTRLTVLMDPGRIKRDVATNRALGPALIPGNVYFLTVEPGWPTADGRGLCEPHRKTFVADVPLRERPDIERWDRTSPRAGTRQPLRVTFDRAFDRHHLSSSVQVVTSDGRQVPGTPEVGEGEWTWWFTPAAPWTGDAVQLAVDPVLEDVAGNTFLETLDRSVEKHSPPRDSAALLGEAVVTSRRRQEWFK